MPRAKKAAKPVDLDSDAIDEFAADDDDDEEDARVDLDALEDGDDSDEIDVVKTPAKKRKAPATASKSSSKASGSNKKQKKVMMGRIESSDDDEDDDDDESEEEDAAPKSSSKKSAGKKTTLVKKIKDPKPAAGGKSIPGQIGEYALQFLAKLQQEKYQNREWFQENDATYRKAWKEWGEFTDAIQPQLQKVDDTLPILPARDLTHRIYRDVRFSTDKRPYKTNFASSFSRSGRKGPYAGYYLQIAANGKSLLAGGKWSMDKNDLATVRHNIQTDPSRLRAVIENKKFVKMFGPAEPNRPAPAKKGKGKKKKKADSDEEEDEEDGKDKKKIPAYGLRQNIFGHEDELINAPKGIAKDHEDIDLLRLRTIAVVKYFDDDEVLSPNFKDRVREVAQVMQPLVSVLNDFLTPNSRDTDGKEGSEQEQEGSD